MKRGAVIRTLAVLVLVMSAPTPVAGQQVLTSPYREQVASEIRGLSAKEIEELREGVGTGMARAAESNGYPGPRHVLEAVQAGQLQLSSEQRGAVQQLFEAMSREARRLGAMIVKEEQSLETAFRTGTIGEPDLRARVARIAALQGELRAVHLRTHLETRGLLTERQIQRYNQLRGYGHDPGGQHPTRH